MFSGCRLILSLILMEIWAEQVFRHREFTIDKFVLKSALRFTLVYAYSDYIQIPNDCIGNIRYHGKIIALLFATEDGNVTLWNVLCEGTNRIISTRGTMTAAYRFPFTTRSILHWSNFKAYSLILPLIKCPDFALCFFPLMFHFSSDTALHLLNGKAKRTGFLQTGY